MEDPLEVQDENTYIPDNLLQDCMVFGSWRTFLYSLSSNFVQKKNSREKKNKMADRGCALGVAKFQLCREKQFNGYRPLVMMALVCSLHGGSFVLIRKIFTELAS